MSVVVERGRARCPRCVAVADYAFVESGPNSVRYEVHCATCGGTYSEVNAPVAPDFTAAVLAVAAPLPDAVERVGGARRERTLAYFTDVRIRPRWLLRRRAGPPTHVSRT